jgi:COP9 signalosome complex subunit 1
VVFSSHHRRYQILAPQDIAVVGGLCALAAFERDELKTKVLDAAGGFKEYLDLVPDVREMLNDFYNSRYASCFTIIDRLRVRLPPSLSVSLRAR